MSDTTTTKQPAESIFGIVLYLYNPLAPHQTPLVGESGKQYVFQRLPEHGERHVLICGSIAEYRAIRLDLLGDRDRLTRSLGHQLGVDFMTEADLQTKQAREAAEAERSKKAAAAANKEYHAGLTTGIRDNARTIVRIKAQRAALGERIAGTTHGPTAYPLQLQYESLTSRLGHIAASFDRMLKDHEELRSEAEHAALRSEVKAIFDGAAPDAGPVVNPRSDGGPVGKPKSSMAYQGAQEEQEPAPVVLPPDLVIRDRLPEEPDVDFSIPAPTAEPAVVVQEEAPANAPPPVAPRKGPGRPPKVKAT